MQALDSEQVNHKALVALGSNLSVDGRPPIVVLQDAVARLKDFVSAQGGGNYVLSTFYQTPAFPEGSGPDFVNAALSFDWPEGPNPLLAQLHAIEADFGRNRMMRWAARGLDLDLIGLGDLILPSVADWQAWANMTCDEAQTRAPDQLILPHPRMAERGFVLVPLCDVAPDWAHPILNKTVAELCAALPQSEVKDIKAL